VPSKIRRGTGLAMAKVPSWKEFEIAYTESNRTFL
jgi:hypothetical protein